MSSEPQITSHERRATSDECVGSALILTVVLTSLLAIIGVLFVMVSRVDKMATSSISENKELNLAVESIVAKISEELVLDVPGLAGQEYYDYPNVDNTWLACLEPYRDGTVYKWRQISDIYNKLDPNLQLQAEVVPDYQNAIAMGEGAVADADGDGVTDSRWIIIPEMSSGKGKPIYAAVRIIGNGAMLNVNTGFKFRPFFDPNDPNVTVLDIGGPGQLQINLMALAGSPGYPPTSSDEIDLLTARANSSYGLDPWRYNLYEKNVIWNYGDPNGPYTPFDISDELELRYRFLLNHSDIDTRLEQWGGYFRFNTLSTPLTSGGESLDRWFERAEGNGGFDPNYAYRHLATTYNMDRIINPAGQSFNGGKMVNVNRADQNLLYEAIRAALPDIVPGLIDYNPVRLAAQLAVNIIDLRDTDTQVSFISPADGSTYYGLETQPFISELAFKISSTGADFPANNHFAIELYNPLDADILLDDFRLEVRDSNSAVVGTIDLTDKSISDGSRFVITNGGAASMTFDVWGITSGDNGKRDDSFVLATYESVQGSDPPEYVLSKRYDVYLIRKTSAGDIYIDRQQTQDEWFDWDTAKNVQQFYARADNDWNVVYQNLVTASNTLGDDNGLDGARKNYNFYNFASAEERFASVGDIARALTIGPRPTTEPEDMIGMRLAAEPDEDAIRLDLQNPAFANIFQYLTVIDPTEHIDPNDYTNAQLYFNETRIKGRININTAPWFVIAQLPWMQPEIAQAVVAYRDKLELVPGLVDYSSGRGVGMVDLDPARSYLPEQVREEPGFASITELLNVTHALANQIDSSVPYNDLYDIRKYGRDKDASGNDKDQDEWPDLTPIDGAENDFEERDLIFSRISNIVTVRSDVFTAYILVRIGTDGPQKRVLAILDRSKVTSPDDKVKIIALHTVPDPR